VAASWLYSAQRHCYGSIFQHALARTSPGTTYLCGGLGRQRCGKLVRSLLQRARALRASSVGRRPASSCRAIGPRTRAAARSAALLNTVSGYHGIPEDLCPWPVSRRTLRDLIVVGIPPWGVFLSDWGEEEEI